MNPAVLVTAEYANMTDALASASETIRLRTGQPPTIVTNAPEALCLAPSRPVILRSAASDIRSAMGESVSEDLRALSTGSYCRQVVFRSSEGAEFLLVEHPLRNCQVMAGGRRGRGKPRTNYEWLRACPVGG